MKDFKQLIIKHRVAALAAVFLIIVFVGFSVTSALNVASRRAQESNAQEAETEQVAATGSEATADEGDVELTDTQRDAIENYDDDTKEFIDSLTGSVWTANGGSYTLLFSGDQYSETVNGEVTEHSFAVLRLEKSTDQTGDETDTAVFETDTGTHIVEYRTTTTTGSDGSAKVTSTLSSSSMFAVTNGDYSRAEATQTVTIKGLNSEVTQLLGDNADKLTSELSNWCVIHYPTVTEADWDQTAFVDWENGTVVVSFTLNNESPVNLSVVYHMDTGAFEFNF